MTYAYPSSGTADENHGKFDYSHHHDMSRGQRPRREHLHKYETECEALIPHSLKLQ